MRSTAALGLATIVQRTLSGILLSLHHVPCIAIELLHCEPTTAHAHKQGSVTVHFALEDVGIATLHFAAPGALQRR
jgi:hypothetical protein